MAIRITGIRKPGGAQNPHEAVSFYRWMEDGTGKSSITDRISVVGWVTAGTQAYVQDTTGRIGCRVRVSSTGTKFLQTYSDSRWTDNLLSLPQC
jgi:hypothetical protein